ncbi:hypothetical protein [Acinetobacter rudis]|nr:hypothetical protein [Acinetobacter rudis]
MHKIQSFLAILTVGNMDLSFTEFIKNIEKVSKAGKEPKKIVVGYKTFSNLMKDEKFVKHISIDVEDPMIRYFKRIELKIVTEKRHLQVI